MLPVRTLEFYSGIGGLHLALQRSNIGGVVVQAFDWDQTACQVYAANHTPVVKKVDISTLSATILAPLQADLWLLSPACQPYTVLNPNAQGASDPRATSFLHLVQNVLPELVTTNSQPTRLLIENVAGFETSTTRQILLSTLNALGYTTVELLLTPLQFGIPNSRLRYYLLAKMKPLAFAHTIDRNGNSNELWRNIPGSYVAWVDPRSQDSLQSSDFEFSNREIRQYLDEVSGEGSHSLYAIPDKVLQKWGRLFDIVLPSSRRTCCFTRGYTKLVERAGSILQMNEVLDTTETFDNFMHAQSNNDPEAVRILHPLGLRYFSPNEELRLFDFNPPGIAHSESSSAIKWPETVSLKSKYRLIGNSVNVRVVQMLIVYLFKDSEDRVITVCD